MIHISKAQFENVCKSLKREHVLVAMFAATPDTHKTVEYDKRHPGDANRSTTVEGEAYDRVRVAHIVTIGGVLRFDIGEGLSKEDTMKLLPDAIEVLGLA